MPQGVWADVGGIPSNCRACGKELTPPQKARWKYKRNIRKNIFGPVCSKDCFGSLHNGTKHEGWKGGSVSVDGYKRVQSSPGITVPEHRLIVERAIGHNLNPKAHVHHVNMDKLDNRKGNLLVCNSEYHKWLEWEMARRYAKEALEE